MLPEEHLSSVPAAGMWRMRSSSGLGGTGVQTPYLRLSHSFSEHIYSATFTTSLMLLKCEVLVSFRGPGCSNADFTVNDYRLLVMTN